MSPFGLTDGLEGSIFGIGSVAVLASACVAVLAPALAREPGRRRFWIAFASLAIVLVPAYGAIRAVPTGHPSLWGDPGTALAIAVARSGLLALLLALAGLALAILLSSETRERPRGTTPVAQSD